jgi:hypothetical protein
MLEITYSIGITMIIKIKTIAVLYTSNKVENENL